MKTAVIGLGARGKLYIDIAQKHVSDFELTAVCDTRESSRLFAAEDYGLKKEAIFQDEESFFSKGRLADVLIVASPDRAHYQSVMKGLQLGYDILLEKPISPDKAECFAIASLAKENGRTVTVCHVLRYTPFYQKIKQLISDGTIGEIVTLSQTENVGFFHQAHSFVRGNWHNDQESSPMILQKCCHDMDIIRWLIDKPCKSISSFGSLSYFTRENAPDKSSERCFDCIVDDCVYNANEFYRNRPDWFGKICDGKTSVDEVLENTDYGRCVYKSDNNVVDHQVVNLLFDANVTAQLTMTAFSKDIRRTIKIHGTKGEIVGDMEGMTIDVSTFEKYGNYSTDKIDVKTLSNDFSGHCGGDIKLIQDFYAGLSGIKSDSMTSVDVSIESHLMAFAAEESRINNGNMVQLKMNGDKPGYI